MNRLRKLFLFNAKGSVVQEYGKTFLYAFLLAMVIRMFVFAPFMIPTGSMRPTLMEGDRILVNKLIYGIRIPFSGKRLLPFSKPRRGDLLVFRSPDRRRDFIKRLVAVEGDEVEIKEMRLWINGKPMDDPPLFKERIYVNRGSYGRVGKKVKIPKGHYFFLGDNTTSSSDSRYFGPIPENHLVGRAFLIIWPFRRLRYFR